MLKLEMMRVGIISILEDVDQFTRELIASKCYCINAMWKLANTLLKTMNNGSEEPIVKIWRSLAVPVMQSRDSTHDLKCSYIEVLDGGDRMYG